MIKVIMFNLINIVHEQKYLQLRMNGVFKDPNVIPSTNDVRKKIKKILMISCVWGPKRARSRAIGLSSSRQY